MLKMHELVHENMEKQSSARRIFHNIQILLPALEQKNAQFIMK